MATYAFETITAAQALAVTSADTLTVAAATGTATGVTVIYAGDGTGDILVTFGSQTVTFGPGLSALSLQPGHLAFDDASLLFVGDASANSITQPLPVATAMFGGDGDDTLSASGPHDLMQGNAGDDQLTGGPGDDTIYGGQGNDLITTGAGTNFAQGNKGNDTIVGNATATDTLLGGQGDDHISGSGFLDGNLGADSLTGSGQLFGEGGNDTLVSAGGGHDTLSGGDGDDSLVATTGTNVISGDAGDDTISIAGGAQIVSGGAGADKFILGAGTTTPGTVPQITDWNGAEDRLSFLGFTPNPSDFTTITASDYPTAVSLATTQTTQHHFSFVAVQLGPDVIIFAGSSGGLTSVVDLVGRSLADFSPSHNLV